MKWSITKALKRSSTFARQQTYLASCISSFTWNNIISEFIFRPGGKNLKDCASVLHVFSNCKSDLPVLFENVLDELSSDQCNGNKIYSAIIEQHVHVDLELSSLYHQRLFIRPVCRISVSSHKKSKYCCL